MFRIKKEAPILYKAFIEKQREKLQAEWKEQEKIGRGTRKEVSYDRTKEIYVTSLFHGCGTTYLSTILATFLSNYYEGKICLIETKGLKEELTNIPIDVFTYPYDIGMLDKKMYDVLIRDVGVFSKDVSNEFWNADLKCIISWPDEISLAHLASFVQQTEGAENFLYFFNLVPKDRENFILNLMKDYPTVILPCTSRKKLEKELIKKLYKIFEEE